MDSPVSVPYGSFVQIDKLSETSVYMQITNQLINAVQRGALPAGTKLPGTRALCNILKVHRNTVIAAYDELLSQGWVESIPNKGTFIIGIKSRASASSESFGGKKTGALSKKCRISFQDIQYPG